MTNLKRAGLIAIAAVGFGCGAALAETTTETFATMDANTDGLVSESEFIAYATTREGHTLDEASAKFASIAGDDGLLSLGELQAVLSREGENGLPPGRS
ncbi:MAG: hypothetical protein AAGF33_16295 [Pseudomonadota bacterium]